RSNPPTAPSSARGRAFRFCGSSLSWLFSGPARWALLDESAHAFLEVGAAVDLAHDVVALRQRPCLLDPAQRFLGRPKRERRVRGDLGRELPDPCFDLLVRNDLMDIPGG